MFKKLSFLLVIFMVPGCTDNLDQEPTDTLTPEELLQDAENLDKILNGVYGAAYYYTGRIQTMTELLANDGDLVYIGGGFLTEFDQKQVITTNGFTRDFWYDSYGSINLCNIVLENLVLVEDTAFRARLEGEAKFLRGLHYFELVRFFALPYEPMGANNQPGVPLVLDGVTDLNQITYPERSTVQEVYENIDSDLQDAAGLLGTDGAPRADRYAALALLARVYLQMGDFAGARDAAHEVLENSGHSLVPEFAGAFNNQADSDEDILAWQITTQDGFKAMVYNNLWATNQFGGNTSAGDVSVGTSFFDLFDGPDDRAQFFYEGNGTLLTGKWQEAIANVPFLRVAEMHLIRAECNFRTGSNLGFPPETEINALRARSSADPITGLTLQDILDERQRELSFEGHRLHDAKRLKEDIGGNPYNADRLVMPIPQSEIDVNPNLEQNPGYGN